MSALPEARLAGRRVLVTGAAGFIGGRLVERLAEAGAEVRGMVHQLCRASRIARYPVALVPGDVRDHAAVGAAAAGCDVVFHCAYGTSGSQRQRYRVNLEGTRQVLAAARRESASRVVHLSSLVVYGHTADGDLDESAPRRPMPDAYSRSKVVAEREALAAAREGLPVAVVQPTAVYGPWGGVWTAQVLAQLATGRVPLVDGGRGLCNAVYVDDLVDAMLRAAVEPAAVGEAFLVSGPEPLPWSEFYGAFSALFGEDRTVPLSQSEAVAHFRRQRWQGPGLAPVLARELAAPQARERLLATREVRLLRWAASRVVPQDLQPRVRAWLAGLAGGGGRAAAGETELPIHAFPPSMLRFLAARTVVRTEKAQRLLGWRPAFDFSAGFARTAAWARWSGLVPPAA